MAGRKPLPTAIKRLTGNPGGRPLNENEPKAAVVCPRPPRRLTTEGRKQWLKVARKLAGARVLTVLDVELLELYCDAWQIYLDATEKLRQFGAVVKSPNGMPVQSPYLSMATRALDQMHKILVEFGMTPSARSRIQAQPEAGPGDPFTAYLNSRPGAAQ